MDYSLNFLDLRNLYYLLNNLLDRDDLRYFYDLFNNLLNNFLDLDYLSVHLENFQNIIDIHNIQDLLPDHFNYTLIQLQNLSCLHSESLKFLKQSLDQNS